MEVPDVPAVTARQGRTTRTLKTLRPAFATPTPDQFYATGTFGTGRWDFQMRATGHDGTTLTSRFSLTIQQ